MGLAGIFNVPGTPNEFASWATDHAAHHHDVDRRILETKQIQIPQFVLDPINPIDLGVWIYQHQALHTAENAALSLSGFDLTDVDWRDKGQFSGWIFLNAVEHRAFSNALGGI